MKSYSRMTHLLIMVGFFSVATGCAFGNRHATLVYPPEEGTKDPGPGVAEASPAPVVTGESIILLQFADKRSKERVIGEVLNGFGMHTADVVTEDSIAEWVTGAVEMELRKAGYEVIDGEDLESPATGPVVTGEVLVVYCWPYFSYDGKVSFVASVKEDGKEILKKQYTGKDYAGTINWAGTARSYAQSLSLALADAIGSLMADLNAIYLAE